MVIGRQKGVMLHAGLCCMLQHQDVFYGYEHCAYALQHPGALVETCLSVDLSSLSDFIDHGVLQTRLGTLLF